MLDKYSYKYENISTNDITMLLLPPGGIGRKGGGGQYCTPSQDMNHKLPLEPVDCHWGPTLLRI